MKLADVALLARYLERSADYHQAHGGPVVVSRRTAKRHQIPRTMTVDEARLLARVLSQPAPSEVA